MESRGGDSTWKRAECSTTPIVVWRKVNDSTDSYQVKTIFYKFNSWARARDTSKYLLAHEQIHFDIAELYARKMRKALGELSAWSESTASKYKAIMNKVYADHIAKQNEYDVKTAHGKSKKVQEAWVIRIDGELDAMKMFASTSEDCISKE